jgi:hypothetical protein
MSEAHSLNAVLHTQWQLYCGLKPYCRSKDDCRCLTAAWSGKNSVPLRDHRVQLLLRDAAAWLAYAKGAANARTAIVVAKT